jgi:hypothetical protein
MSPWAIYFGIVLWAAASFIVWRTVMPHEPDRAIVTTAIAAVFATGVVRAWFGAGKPPRDP